MLEHNETLSKAVNLLFCHGKVVEIHDCMLKFIAQGKIIHSNAFGGFMIKISLGSIDTTYCQQDTLVTMDTIMVKGDHALVTKNVDNFQPIAPFSIVSIKTLVCGDSSKKKVLF